MKKAIITVFATLAAMTASAGEMRTTTDKFTGKVHVQYTSTVQEAQQSKVVVVVSKASANTVYVSVKPWPSRTTHCKYNPLLLKDNKGTIYEIAAQEIDFEQCWFEVRPSLIVNGFSMRVPMFQSGNLDFTFNTNGLQFNKLTDF